MREYYSLLMDPDDRSRQLAVADFFRSRRVSGFHYVSWCRETHDTMVMLPSMLPHDAACRFINSGRAGRSPGSRRTKAAQLKHFLDYLRVLGEPDLTDGHLVLLVQGYSSYLRCIDPREFRRHKNTARDFWRASTGVPVSAEMSKKVIRPQFQRLQLEQPIVTGGFSSEQIATQVHTAVQFLLYLDESDPQLRGRIGVLDRLPTDVVYVNSKISGTAGPQPKVRVKVSELAGIDMTWSQTKPVSWDQIPSGKALHLFRTLGTDTFHAQDRMLFHLLQFCAFRRGEVTGIFLEPSLLPALDLIRRMRDGELEQHLKKQLAWAHGTKPNEDADIRWVTVPGASHWEVRVGLHNLAHIDSRAKRADYNGARYVPWLEPQEVFSSLLCGHLKARAWTIKQNAVEDPGYLFLNRQAKPIRGDTVRDKWERAVGRIPADHHDVIAFQTEQEESVADHLARFSTHSLRHWCASYWLFKRKMDVALVQTLLGHRSSETTEAIYKHLSPDFMDLELFSKEMANHFGEFDYWES